MILRHRIEAVCDQHKKQSEDEGRALQSSVLMIRHVLCSYLCLSIDMIHIILGYIYMRFVSVYSSSVTNFFLISRFETVLYDAIKIWKRCG